MLAFLCKNLDYKPQSINLSPLLFNVYVNELSELLNKSGFGGNMGGIIINHMLYADDICIVSLSSSGLRQLLNICIDYCEIGPYMI